MEQTAFNFDQQDNRRDLGAQEKDELRPVERHSDAYLVNALDSALITIARRFKRLPCK